MNIPANNSGSWERDVHDIVIIKRKGRKASNIKNRICETKLGSKT